MKIPNQYKNKEERISLWYEEMRKYLFTPSLLELMGEFGFCPDYGLEFKEYLKSVKRFVEENWSYRKNAGGGERASIVDNSQKVMELKDLIIETAQDLELIKTKEKKIKNYDYIFPLGGFRAATFDRIEWAKRYYNTGNGKVAALTGHRNIQEIEIPFLTYIPEEKRSDCDEFTTAYYGMETVFGCEKPKEIIEEINGSQGMIRRYGEDLFVLCAPTPPGKSRANTLDTLKYWLKIFKPDMKTSILCITSPIYTSYQTAALAGFAIENELLIEFDACGEPGKQNKVITNYLQEIKGTVDAFVQFAEQYENG